MTGDEKREAIRRKLDRGESLTPGEVAILLDTSRTKVHGMLTAGEVPFKRKFRSRHRVIEPGEVRKLLAETDDTEPPAE